MVAAGLFRLAVISLCSFSFVLGGRICKASGRACRTHKQCCGDLICTKKNKRTNKLVCKSPGPYAKQWIKATSSRRFTYYTKNDFSTRDHAIKWSNTLAEAAQSWTNYLIQLDDCQGLSDPSCYDIETGFSKFCKIVHEGDGVGSSDPYGLENLYSSGADSELDLQAISTPEAIMQIWWDGEESAMGGHFRAAAKISSRYMGCAKSTKEVVTPSGLFYCHITACRYMTRCGSQSLFDPNPLCDTPMCPIEGC
ncbi:hypothetical protein MPSEU_000921900 [Mayamaea pseudoterrestris]|nr:hypothetical protein MPSEU_000921900 [Mayamaea pseudoterrestris]